MVDYSEVFVGIDVAKARNAIAIADGGRGGEVRFLGEVDASEENMRRVVKRIAAKYSRVYFCYEAGPTGYGLHCVITSLGHSCIVVAPSLIPRRPGDQVKTNRRDAVALARLLRAGELTAVWVPDEGHEAMRDLVRARAAAVDTRNMAEYTNPRRLVSHVTITDPHHFLFGSRLPVLPGRSGRGPAYLVLELPDGRRRSVRIASTDFAQATSTTQFKATPNLPRISARMLIPLMQHLSASLDLLDEEVIRNGPSIASRSRCVSTPAEFGPASPTGRRAKRGVCGRTCRPRRKCRSLKSSLC